MYSVSNAYKTAMHDRVQSFRVRGNVGGVAFADENILAGSLSITNQCSGSDMIEIGQVYIGELNCTFLDLAIARNAWYGKEITIYFGQQLANGSYEDIPLGVFTVAEAEYTKSGVVVKAYDHMAKLDKTCSELIAGATPFNLARQICQRCNVTFETTEAQFQSFANHNVILSAYNESDVETYRDVLAWLAQTCGCFATASRAGGIVFKSYGSVAVDTIDDTNRFTDCSFSDFSTRYTGMSVVDMASQKTNYYSVTPDDALTYNLGSNPYLQIAASHSLTTMRRNVLNALASINFTPFTAKCIGNPAYDLGDVLVFTGGIADSTKLSCITRYTWTYNVGYEMTGAGKNPALATAYSKSDKNIAGLISRTTDNKLLHYTLLRNRQDITINAGAAQSVLLAQFLSSEGEHVRINVEVLLMAIPDDESLTVRAIYILDGDEVTTRYPTETWDAGRHILTLQYDVPNTEDGAHIFDLRLEVSGGRVFIAANDAYEVLTSTGIFSENVWEGTVRGEDGNLYLIIDGVAYKVPDSIEVTTPPTKTVYSDDEPLDYSGLVVSAVYGDRTKTVITDECELNPAENTPYSSERDDYVEVSYTYMQLNYSTGFNLAYNGILRIEMEALPDKLNYYEGELIDYTGARVVAVYQSGTTVDITAECTFIPSNGTVFNYDALKANSGLTTIAVTAPDRTLYAEGDILDYTGCEVWAYFADGSYQNVTSNAVFMPSNGSIVTSSTRDRVSVSYTAPSGEAASTNFVIRVTKLRSITAICSTPIVYRVGQPIDYSAVTVTANYTDGSTRDVTANVIYDPPEGTPITSSLKGALVKYTNAAGIMKTDTISVNVVQLTSIRATRPTKYEYRYGEAISYAGTVVTARYSDGSSEDVTASAVFSVVAGAIVGRSTPSAITVSYSDLEGTTVSTEIEIEIVTLSSLVIVSEPTKTSYGIGEALDLTGLVVRAMYSNASWDTVTNDCEFSPNDGATLSAQDTSVRVYYSNASFETALVDFNILVGMHVLSGISVTSPTKTTYKYGETLDYSGLVVTAQYLDGTSETVTTGISISPAEGSAFTSNTSISALVSYDEFTAPFTLTCNSITSLVLVLNPLKLTYTVGETVNYTGVLIRAVYADNSTTDVTAQCVFSPAQGTTLTTVGTRSVVVSYASQELTFNISVEVNTVKSLEITDNDTAIYAIGDTWDFSNVQVIGVYGDGSREVVSCVFSPAQGAMIVEDGDLPVTATYNGVSATFTRTVVGDSTFLNYVNYTKSDTEMSVRVKSLKLTAISPTTDITIYSKIAIDGKVYDVIIDD